MPHPSVLCQNEKINGTSVGLNGSIPFQKSSVLTTCFKSKFNLKSTKKK